MKKMKLKLEGIAPMLMHNKRTCDPTDPYTIQIKEITCKRKKTDEDYGKLSNLEFLAGLYMDDKGKFFIPGEQIEMAIAGHANSVNRKLGKMSLLAKLWADGPFYLTAFDGPSKAEERMHDRSCIDNRSVVISRSRVMRTRPIFRNWIAEGTIMYDDISEKEIIGMLDLAQNTGLGDFRPKFGRFIYSICK